MPADFGSSREPSQPTSDARPSARPGRFVPSDLTRLDLSDAGNLKDAEFEFRRAQGDGVSLVKWARKWGEALCRAVEEFREHVALVDDDAEADLTAREAEAQEHEAKLDEREETLAKREEDLESREDDLAARITALDEAAL